MNDSEITLDDYQRLAGRTAGAGGSGERRMMVSALGLAGEAGEFTNLIKKLVAPGHTISPCALADELGDVLWYVAEAASACGLSLGEIGMQNIQKLSKRYPHGFDQERSVNRES